MRRGIRWRTTSPAGHNRRTISSIAMSASMSGLHNSVSINSSRRSGQVVSTMCDSARKYRDRQAVQDVAHVAILASDSEEPETRD